MLEFLQNGQQKPFYKGFISGLKWHPALPHVTTENCCTKKPLHGFYRVTSQWDLTFQMKGRSNPKGRIHDPDRTHEDAPFTTSFKRRPYREHAAASSPNLTD